MRDLFAATQFGKDLAREYKTWSGATKSLKLRTELALVVGRLLFNVPLEASHRDHAMTGNWAGFRDCHVFPDLVLIYHVYTKSDPHEHYGSNALVLARLGSHSELGI